MREFANLYRALDETTKTSRKLAAMRRYFAQVDSADGAWAVFFLSGRRLKRLIRTALLRRWSAEAAGIPEWLFEECYGEVGDLAETIALLLPLSRSIAHLPLHVWVEEWLLPLTRLPEPRQRERLTGAWNSLSTHERFVFNKLVTGSFRVGVSQRLMSRALAEVAGRDVATIAHRLMGHWEPTPEFFRSLFAPEDEATDISRPYPFCLAHPLQDTPASLGDPQKWRLEWKWDGIRAQLIRRRGESYVWSRGEESILHRFPELVGAAATLPDGTVLDGEIVGWKDGRVLPFGELQRRIGRKSVGKRLLREVPARYLAFDVLELDGSDVRARPLRERRQLLEKVLSGQPETSAIAPSPIIEIASWEESAALRETSRDRAVEGLMLKRADSPYAVGRPTGVWWKWKIDPLSCDAVLIYAQRGHGRRASLYTDYTFGVWHAGHLVPFAKAYSGLTDEEIHAVDRFVRRNTIEKFGPVRAVKPELVFELAFEHIRPSKRHKSGVAVRFPRMARWRHDKRPEDADTLESLKALMRLSGR